MRNLRECVIDAKNRGVAVGHFNISTVDQLHAIVDASKELNVPVIIGVSEGERDFVGVDQAVSLVKSFHDEGLEIFLNADHTYSFDRVKEAIDAGFDSVIFDGAKLSIEENIKITKNCVEYAKQSGRDVLVEGELGYIGQSSKLLSEVPDGVELTSVLDAKRYVEETGVDLFAPAIGNIHGMLKDVPDPRLDIERVRDIGKATNIPLVLHGASGNSKEDIQEVIKNGVAVVHINTEIRVAWKKGEEDVLRESPNEVAPYKLLAKARENVKQVVLEKLRIFNNL